MHVCCTGDDPGQRPSGDRKSIGCSRLPCLTQQRRRRRRRRHATPAAPCSVTRPGGRTARSSGSARSKALPTATARVRRSTVSPRPSQPRPSPLRPDAFVSWAAGCFACCAGVRGVLRNRSAASTGHGARSRHLHHMSQPASQPSQPAKPASQASQPASRPASHHALKIGYQSQRTEGASHHLHRRIGHPLMRRDPDVLVCHEADENAPGVGRAGGGSSRGDAEVTGKHLCQLTCDL
jgi:hypothetical protein